jgi:hypothetical protein
MWIFCAKEKKTKEILRNDYIGFEFYNNFVHISVGIKSCHLEYKLYIKYKIILWRVNIKMRILDLRENLSRSWT